MEILSINGSPRKGGNTEILLDSINAGAKDAGALVSRIDLRKLDVHPCRACDTCKRTGKCVQKDDMEYIISAMHQADVWVLGTPVYWWGVTAQLKAFIDRWYGVDREFFKNRKVVVAVPFESSNIRTADHVVGMFKDIFDYLTMNQIGMLLAPGVYERGDIENKPDYLRDAENLGRSITKI